MNNKREIIPSVKDFNQDSPHYISRLDFAVEQLREMVQVNIRGIERLTEQAYRVVKSRLSGLGGVKLSEPVESEPLRLALDALQVSVSIRSTKMNAAVYLLQNSSRTLPIDNIFSKDVKAWSRDYQSYRQRQELEAREKAIKERASPLTRAVGDSVIGNAFRSK